MESGCGDPHFLLERPTCQVRDCAVVLAARVLSMKSCGVLDALPVGKGARNDCGRHWRCSNDFLSQTTWHYPEARSDMDSWRKTSTALLEIAKDLNRAWQVEIPRRDCVHSESLERSCDEWCKKLAADVHAPLHPPRAIRPWILARLVAMSEKAAELHRLGFMCAPELTELTMRVYLIDEWNLGLAKAWTMTGELPVGAH